MRELSFKTRSHDKLVRIINDMPFTPEGFHIDAIFGGMNEQDEDFEEKCAVNGVIPYSLMKIVYEPQSKSFYFDNMRIQKHKGALDLVLKGGITIQKINLDKWERETERQAEMEEAFNDLKQSVLPAMLNNGYMIDEAYFGFEARTTGSHYQKGTEHGVKLNINKDSPYDWLIKMDAGHFIANYGEYLKWFNSMKRVNVYNK